MPTIKESDNKNISTNTNSSTDNIENIKINEVSTINNIPIENYDLDETLINKDTFRIAKTIEIPTNVSQTGICKNCTDYSYFFDKWNADSEQKAIADMWNEAGRPNKNGIATLNGRYLVAVTDTFGTNGDIIDVVLRDGTVIHCIVGDVKGEDATSPYGHILGENGVDVIEWEAYGAQEDIVIDEWANKGVQQIINKGSIFSN